MEGGPLPVYYCTYVRGATVMHAEEPSWTAVAGQRADSTL